MLMVIFGAGASYDSVPSRPPRAFPPMCCPTGRHLPINCSMIGSALCRPYNSFRSAKLLFRGCVIFHLKVH